MSNKDTLAASGGNNEQGATEADATAFRQGNHALAAHPEASPKRRVVNPAGTTIQSASLEQRARSLLPDGWTHDCQGKQDYDADLLALSCRYYPANYQRNGKAAVSAAVVWGEGDERLFHATLEAETESQVKAMAESWAAEKIVAIRAALGNQQGVEKDAERYRWLRVRIAGSDHVAELVEFDNWKDELGREVDTAIDAARQGEGGAE